MTSDDLIDLGMKSCDAVDQWFPLAHAGLLRAGD
jgi:hypothetical protein